MSVGNITGVVTKIKAAGDGLIVDGVYTMNNGQIPKSGKVMVRVAGDFGTSTISVGYLDGGVFNVVKQADGTTDASFTEFFALNFDCGRQVTRTSGPAIQVATMDAATDLNLTITEIE